MAMTFAVIYGSKTEFADGGHSLVCSIEQMIQSYINY
jgi:hypothetical protein